ncbi:hypothetical protein DFH07DRAFT_814328 [Mycena maculata]|uniref:F-box domain-containing protein n=1 Tax=Mycena maculata TaxID=230809 RepID=A0AAD7JD82_9AGAR|nr:hypothetical protein DFH07DRAFT_814328 [Mycena maculata]
MAETLSTALLLAQSGITGVKERAQELIAESRANIARFESQIKDLERLRTREYAIIAALRLITAPVRTLPTELLGRIFVLVLEAGAAGDSVGWTVPIKDVLVLSQVCQNWRKAAHETPQLWARRFPIFSQTRPGEASLTATKIFMERSAPLPVPISLGSGYDASAGTNLVPLMDTLFAIPHRWLAVTLSTKLLATLAQIPAGTLTALETLDLRSTGGEAELHPNVNVFLLAPRLRRVTLWHIKNTDTFPIPWSQLTTLALADESPKVCLDIIVRCTNLVSATLRMSGWPQSVSLADTETVTLEHLKSLEIHISNTSSDEHFTPFLQRLNLPCLTALKMYGEYHSGVITWSAVAFTLFQIRSPLIEQLQIDHCALTSEDLQAVVHHATSVIHLEVHNCSNCIDDAFLASLRYSEIDPAPLIPKLEVLWLSSLRCDFEESTLRDMVESRWWTEDELLVMPAPPAVARLRDVRYTSSRKFSKMQVYRAEGLEFRTLIS